MSAPRRRLTRDDVVAAAMAEVRDASIGQLTMRAVADRLGVAPMSLYRHVHDRDELVDLLVDRAAADLELPPDPDTADPATWLRAMTEVVRERLLRYPGSAEHLLLHGPTGPHTLSFMATVCAVLRRTGRQPAETAWAYDWLMTTVAAYVSKEVRGAASDRPADLMGTLAARTLQHLADRPDVLEVVMSFTGDVAAAYRRATGFVIDALVTGAESAPIGQHRVHEVARRMAPRGTAGLSVFRHPLVRVADSPVAGRGVFAVADLAEGQVAEVAPVLLLHRVEGDQSGTLARYVFEWDTDADDTAYAMALGWGSLFNHSGTPTCQYLRADDDETIAGLLGEPYDPGVHGNLAPALVFVMNRAVPAGEELTIDYSGVGDDDFVFPD